MNLSATSDARRLIVVSNRLPVSVEETSQVTQIAVSAGGLVTALEPVLRNSNGLWIGWPGADGDPAKLQDLINASEVTDGYKVATVDLSAEDIEEFYEGFSNRVLWPLFHDHFALCSFQPRYWRAYQRVNAHFAEKVMEQLQPGDIVWVHDYHLLCLAAELRKAGICNAIGFFNHIPFPTADIFGRLPWAHELLRDMLQFDLIGFQNKLDERHFAENLEVSSCARVPRLQHENSEMSSVTEVASTGAFPVSIDVKAFRDLASSKQVVAQRVDLQQLLGGSKLILGIDRLDYSKGLPQKFAAYRHLLEVRPEFRARVTLVQFVVPSRQPVPEYAKLREQLEQMVGAINGDLSEAGWVPIHYHFDSLTRETLCAYYALADVCLVTSLKDGMNLIAKEFVTCQVDEPGVLVLSQFAGAATELSNGALVINPYDVEQTADALAMACEMPLDERHARMARLKQRVAANTVFDWVEQNLTALEKVRSKPRFERSGSRAAGSARR